MDKRLDFYCRALVFFLLASAVLIGTGPFEIWPGGGFGAWSLSRTTFFFWLIWKLILRIHTGEWRADWVTSPIFILLLSFFMVVTISLIPDFYQSIGDFRYLFFGCAHAVMIMDVFRTRRRLDYLLLILALTPGILLVRGILYDPEILKFEAMRRLGDPLDHANTVGYVLSMSLPLVATMAFLLRRRPLPSMAYISAAAQLAALVLTYSRGAWLGAAVGLGSLSILQKNWRLITAAAIALVL